MSGFDKRILKVGIEVNGQLQVYQDLKINVQCEKFANELQNTCDIEITNLKKETLNYILTETSPYNPNKTPKVLTVDAGRESIGLSRVFEGNIASSSVSQPPDVTLSLKALTKNFSKGNISSVSYGANTQLSTISKGLADQLGLTLDFQASDSSVSNYNYSGAVLKQVKKINDVGQVSAYIDDNTLIVKNLNSPITNTLTIVNADTGMVGIPELTEHGIKVTFMYDGITKLGGLIQLTSKIYPAVNGRYTIYKLSYELTNRDTPFYTTVEASRNAEQ